MGRCITIITLVGASSLGLLTGSLAHQALQQVPDLIRQISQETSAASRSSTATAAAVRSKLTVGTAINVALASLLSWLFKTAYCSSPAAGKHPYLVYSAVGAPLALAAVVLLAYMPLSVLTGLQRRTGGKPRSKPAKAASPLAADKTQDERLDQSYIHVSEDSLSLLSVSPPSSPIQPTTSAIEEEVEFALQKKECVRDLEAVQWAATVGSAVAGLTTLVCGVGIIGEHYFL